MKSLLDLMADAEQRAFLAQRGMHSDLDRFAGELAPPRDPALNRLLGLSDATELVHIGQQVCTDYQPATLTKFEVVDALRAYPGVATAILWHDADRADTEKLGMRIVLRTGPKTVGLTIAHRSTGHAEPRFIPVEPAAVATAMEQLGRWAMGRSQDRGKAERIAAKERLDLLVDTVRIDAPVTLAQFNARLAGFLLREGIGVQVPSTFLSTMLDAGLLTASVTRYVDAREDVIRVFNEAVDELLALDIDPHVKHLGPDYLPLHYYCPVARARVRLTHARDGAQQLATVACSCGSTHTFPLGSSELGIAELVATGTWSSDISLPVHHNAIASGWVVGRSTAVYGLVLNAVMTRVFGERPIPGLIPPSLTASASASVPDGDADSLLAEYLTR